jgi:hypothetical protein
VFRNAIAGSIFWASNFISVRQNACHGFGLIEISAELVESRDSDVACSESISR